MRPEDHQHHEREAEHQQAISRQVPKQFRQCHDYDGAEDHAHGVVDESHARAAPSSSYGHRKPITLSTKPLSTFSPIEDELDDELEAVTA